MQIVCLKILTFSNFFHLGHGAPFLHTIIHLVIWIFVCSSIKIYLSTEKVVLSFFMSALHRSWDGFSLGSPDNQRVEITAIKSMSFTFLFFFITWMLIVCNCCTTFGHHFLNKANLNEVKGKMKNDKFWQIIVNFPVTKTIAKIWISFANFSFTLISGYFLLCFSICLRLKQLHIFLI